METIQGSVEKVLFYAEDGSFAVLRVLAAGYDLPITITGPLPWVSEGSYLTCQGVWQQHKTYGTQFSVTTCEVSIPVDHRGIRKYLSSGIIKGIGPSLANRIVDQFGESTLDIMDHHIEKLKKVAGIGEKKLISIQKSIEKNRQDRLVMIKLQGLGISLPYIRKIMNTLGPKAWGTIEKNPYCLAKMIPGIGFKLADQFAGNIGIQKDSLHRIQAGVDYFLHEKAGVGHTCYPLTALYTECAIFLQLEEKVVEEALQDLPPFLVRMQDRIGLSKLYAAETSVASDIRRILEYSGTVKKETLLPDLEKIEEQLQMQFASQQREAIKNSCEQKMHIITGGPGTGKSTIIKAVVMIASQASRLVILCAPTGRAAKRMQEITGYPASTIHSLLQYDFKKKSFRRNKYNPLVCDIIVVDESSMIDIVLMQQLMSAIPSHAHVVFVGDVHQLPSIGPGNVLKDMIASTVIPTTYLSEIFRQGRHSKIIQHAHMIQQGYMPDLSFNQQSDFFYLAQKDPEKIIKTIEALVTWRLPKRYSFHSLSDIQVLSPMRRGVIGIDALNQHLQSVLNPTEKNQTIGSKTFRVGDKVMQIKNNYQKEIFNGDIGFIQSIKNETLVVSFEDKQVSYDPTDIEELVLAYAISVHKYQGSECPCIIMPIHISHYMMLKRNLLYTAITRGKQLVILIGMKQAIAAAIHRVDEQGRMTYLCERLSHLCSV